MTHEDATLLCLLKENKEEAFSMIYKKYWAALFDAAYKRIRSREICEEIVQDIFVDFYTRCGEIEITHSLASYLFASLKYQVLNRIRAGKAQVNHEAMLRRHSWQHAAFIPGDLRMKELEGAIEQSIGRLPEKCREVFLLSRFGNLTHASIAERMSISVSTVEKHIVKARKLLRVYLKEFDPLLIMPALHALTLLTSSF